MENNDVPARKSPSRRLFLSASAATAVTVPLIAQAATAHAATTSAASAVRSSARIDPELRKMLKENGSPPADGRWADIAVLEPVRDYKARHASTLLTFDAVVSAIDQIEQKRGATAAAAH